ncbi:hypothetical protein ACB092_02G209200 [Castanea dentata]
MVHCQGIERKPLEEISNYSPQEECHSGSAMEKEVQRITKLELKRIDPSLRSKKTGLEEEDYPQAEDRCHSGIDMQVEQGDMVRVHSPAIMIIMETRVCGDRARRIVDRIPMDGAIIDNSIGLSGGLWLLWDSSQVEVVEPSSTKQEIHTTVSSSSKPHWILSAIYGDLMRPLGPAMLA